MKELLYLIAVLLLAVSVAAHGNVLYDVKLDFDQDLKSGVIDAAQAHIGSNEAPVQYDYERELINVKFGTGSDHYVSIHPIDFTVFGYRNDNLVSRETPTMSQEERKALAETMYQDVPDAFKSEYRYGEEKKLYTGTFVHRWYRYIDDIVVLNDEFMVEVDGATGEVVAWRLSPFFYPKTQVKTTPAITHQVAQHIALLSFDAEPLADSQTVLVVDNGELLWQVKVKKLYPLFVYVNAHDGRVRYVGAPRGELPDGYDKGTDVEVVPTEEINRIIGG